MDRRWTLQRLTDLAHERRGAFLSASFTTMKEKYHWRCIEGHEWHATAANVAHKNSWCPVCGNIKQGRSKALSIDDARRIAAERGGQCLSDDYHNQKTILRWMCEYGHEWKAAAGSVRQGSWCPQCAGRFQPEVHLAKMRVAAEARNGALLETEYRGPKGSHKVRCAKGHEWDLTPHQLLRGSWCAVCDGQRLSYNNDQNHDAYLKRYQDLATSRGGALLSPEYLGSGTRLKWKCSDGHTWEQKPSHVLKGTWCPECANGLSERYVRSVLEHLTGHSFPKKRPAWLQSDFAKRLELDGYSEKLGIAFEYQGAQHYVDLPHFRSTYSDLPRRKSLDEHKRRACLEKGVLLLEIPYTWHKNEIPARVSTEISQAMGLSFTWDHSSFSFLDTYSRGRLAELREAAVARGGQLLSDMYLGNNTPLRWRCAKGHEWDALPSYVPQKSWCARCIGRIPSAEHLSEMKEVASSRGGVCISDEKPASGALYFFRCKDGHEWASSRAHIKQGKWCPRCKYRGSRKGSLIDLQTYAKSKGGLCLADNYSGSSKNYLWQCQYGHQWEAGAYFVLKGGWCQKCRGRGRRPYKAG